MLKQMKKVESFLVHYSPVFFFCIQAKQSPEKDLCFSQGQIYSISIYLFIFLHVALSKSMYFQDIYVLYVNRENSKCTEVICVSLIKLSIIWIFKITIKITRKMMRNHTYCRATVNKLIFTLMRVSSSRGGLEQKSANFC